MEIGDWKTLTVFDRYNIVSEGDPHDAAAGLERHVAGVEKARDKDKACGGEIDS